MPRIRIINDQDRIPITEDLVKMARAASKAAHEVARADGMLKASGRRGTAWVNVCLMCDDAIRELNCRYLGMDEPTDVLAFPLEGPGTGAGDIAISVETARRQAQEYGHGFDREICLLVAHGVLHLSGYDDGAPEDARKMREAESRALARLTFSDPGR